MTVGELIANLRQYPADATVLVNCGSGRPFQAVGTTELYWYPEDNLLGIRGVVDDDD
jgi:hypothetical protein